MKSLALPPSFSQSRPKKLRFVLLGLAGKIASHAGSLMLRISQGAERLVQLVQARARLLSLTAAGA
jgi:hypothetical protein